MSLRTDLTRAIAAARERAAVSGDLAIPDGGALPEIGIEQPANPDHGDWASNAAMQLAPVARIWAKSRAIAARSGRCSPSLLGANGP